MPGPLSDAVSSRPLSIRAWRSLEPGLLLGVVYGTHVLFDALFQPSGTLQVVGFECMRLVCSVALLVVVIRGLAPRPFRASPWISSDFLPWGILFLVGAILATLAGWGTTRFHLGLGAWGVLYLGIGVVALRRRRHALRHLLATLEGPS